MMIRALMGLALTQPRLAFANGVWVVLLLRFLQGTGAGYIAPAQAEGCVHNTRVGSGFFSGLTSLFLCVAVMYLITLVITLKISPSSRESKKYRL